MGGESPHQREFLQNLFIQGRNRAFRDHPVTQTAFAAATSVVPIDRIFRYGSKVVTFYKGYRNTRNARTLYEIGDGVRRAKATQMLWRRSIQVVDNAGNTFSVPIKNLRSPMKSVIDVSTPRNLARWQNVKELVKARNAPPIYVTPGSRGVSVKDIILKY